MSLHNFPFPSLFTLIFPGRNFLADFDIKFYCWWFCRNTKVLQFPYKFSYLEIDFLFFRFYSLSLLQESSLKLDVVISINLGGFFFLSYSPPHSLSLRDVEQSLDLSLSLEASTFILDDFCVVCALSHVSIRFLLPAI